MSFGEENVMSKSEKLSKEELRARRRESLFKSVPEEVKNGPNSKVTMLPLDQIDPNPDNEGLNGTEEIDELAGAMKEDGFLGILVVVRKENARYEISWGHRRYLALKMNGETEAPCIVLDKKSDIEKAKLLLRGNMNLRDVTPLITAKRIDYYIQHVFKPSGEKGKAKDAAAKFFGISPSNVHRYQCILKVNKDLQNLTSDIEFPFSALQKAVNLDADGQDALYQWIISKQEDKGAYPTRDEIEGKIEALSGEEKSTGEKAEKQRYIDNTLARFEKSLERDMGEIKEPEKVRESILRIKALIAELEKQL